MRAWLVDAPGAKIRLGTVESPAPGPGEVRLRVHAAGLNPADYKLLHSGYPAWTFPHVPGLDVAGEIDAIGPGVTGWALGTRVFGHLNLARPGCFAEFAVAPDHILSAMPAGLDEIAAAALPCAGMTAYQSLHRRLRIEVGQTLLVLGGAGGVGSFAVQLGRIAGARVAATCSPRNDEWIRALGAEVAFDYRTPDLQERALAFTGGRGFDAIVDTVGPESATAALDLLAFQGGLACVAGLPDLRRLRPFDRAPSMHEIALGGAHLSGDRRAQEDLARMGGELAALAATGRLQTPAEVLPFEQLADGLERLEQRHVRGKLVVRVS